MLLRGSWALVVPFFGVRRNYTEELKSCLDKKTLSY